MQKCFGNTKRIVFHLQNAFEAHLKHVVNAKHKDPNWVYQMDLLNFAGGSFPWTKLCELSEVLISKKCLFFRLCPKPKPKHNFNVLQNVSLMSVIIRVVWIGQVIEWSVVSSCCPYLILQSPLKAQCLMQNMILLFTCNFWEKNVQYRPIVVLTTIVKLESDFS